jgi:hypothetical protein
MRNLRTNLSILAVFAGIAAASIATSGSALAARGCAGGSPVCGMKADGPKTYDSACAAKADGAKVSHLGACQLLCQGFAPTLIAQPMCGMDPLNHARMTYPNNCEAENARAIWLHNGPCK